MTSEPAQTPGTATGATTLVDVLNRLEADGFGGQFAARPGATIECLTCRRPFPAGEAAVVDLRRLEGASDPADMAAVGALTCPKCEASGTLVMKFGPDATPEELEALEALADHR